MIIRGTYDDFGVKRDAVSIDLSTTKNKERIIDFLESRRIDDETIYNINLRWMQTSNYHPTLSLTQNEMNELIHALTQMYNEHIRALPE